MDKCKKQSDIDITASGDCGKRNGLDMIYRQDAIAIIEAKEANEYGNYLEYNVAFNDGLRSAVFAIEELPSEEPVIYCKYCVRHNVSVQDWYDNHELKVCPLVDHRGKAQGHEFDYQFCVYAERKEDE